MRLYSWVTTASEKKEMLLAIGWIKCRQSFIFIYSVISHPLPSLLHPSIHSFVKAIKVRKRCERVGERRFTAVCLFATWRNGWLLETRLHPRPCLFPRCPPCPCLKCADGQLLAQRCFRSAWSKGWNCGMGTAAGWEGDVGECVGKRRNTENIGGLRTYRDSGGSLLGCGMEFRCFGIPTKRCIGVPHQGDGKAREKRAQRVYRRAWAPSSGAKEVLQADGQIIKGLLPSTDWVSQKKERPVSLVSAWEQRLLARSLCVSVKFLCGNNNINNIIIHRWEVREEIRPLMTCRPY